MKNLLLLFMIVFSVRCNAQYGQRLHAFFMGVENKALPIELKQFRDSLAAVSGNLFFRNLQRSGGMNSSYTSFDLLFSKEFNLLSSGFTIKGNNSDAVFGGKMTSVYVRAEDTWKASKVVDFDDFDPKNNTKLFFYYIYFLNMTDRQVLAHFVNSLPYNSKKSSLRTFIDDVIRVNKINIDSELNENTDDVLGKLCQQINRQMPDSDCTFSAYRTYLLDKNPEITRKNINSFFGKLNISNIESLVNDFLLPRGKIMFDEPKIMLILPKKHFYESSKNDKSQISFYISEIQHHLTYDYAKEEYVLKLKILPFRNSLSSPFNFTGSYHNVLKGKTVTENIPINNGNFVDLEFDISSARFQVSVNTKEGNFERKYPLTDTFRYGPQSVPTKKTVKKK